MIARGAFGFYIILWLDGLLNVFEFCFADSWAWPMLFSFKKLK